MSVRNFQLFNFIQKVQTFINICDPINIMVRKIALYQITKSAGELFYAIFYHGMF